MWCVQVGSKKVGVLQMNSPPVNALSAGLRVDFEKHLATLAADASVDAIVVRGANGAFCAGADIAEFASGARGPSLIKICADMESCAKPVVAFVDGVALGGGLEVALGCHFRVVQ